MLSELQTNFYFTVSIPGSNNADIAFKEVTGLSKELGIEEVVCGGENRFKYRLPTITTFHNLVLKRGVIKETSPLIAWCKSTLDNGLSTAIVTKDITVKLLDADSNVSMAWLFSKAYPVKWAVSDLKSQEAEVLIETIEFAYQYFELDDR
jgi:phage tail-like protein